MFIIPLIWEAKLKAKNEWPIYLYNLEYANPETFNKLPFESDLLLIFFLQLFYF